jgi:uncharacterized protein
MKKIIIDTSLLITFLISNGSSLELIFQMVKENKIQIYISASTLKELQDTIKKETLKKHIQPVNNKVAKFIAWYKYNTTMISPTEKVTLCRDENDDMFLELAKEIDADFILSGDKDLLSISQFEDCKIIKPTDFLKIFLE